MATAGVESPTPDRKPAINFSRPRLNSNATTTTTEPSRSRPTTPKSPQTHSVSAFHSPTPTHPRIQDEYTLDDDDDNDRSNLTSSSGASSRTAASDFAWDAHRNELISRPQLPPSHPNDRPAAAAAAAPAHHNHRHLTSEGSSSSTSSSTSSSARTATAESIKNLMPKSILKHTQVEQYSERADGGSEAGESSGSHHTVSEDGGGEGGEGGGSFDENGKWTSSDYDTSGLSEKEIRKLEKKGVNPSLYAEMKAARKGKSCVGGLTGNAYVT